VITIVHVAGSCALVGAIRRLADISLLPVVAARLKVVVVHPTDYRQTLAGATTESWGQ
jgi:hypothetical protein